MATNTAGSVSEGAKRSWWAVGALFAVALVASAGLAVGEHTLAQAYRRRVIERARHAHWPWLLEYPDAGGQGFDLAAFGSTDQLAPTEATVEVHVDGQDATIVTRWTGPKDHPLFRAALARAGGDGRAVRDAIVFVYLSPLSNLNSPIDLDLALHGDEARVVATERLRVPGDLELIGGVLSRFESPARVRLTEVQLSLGAGERLALAGPAVPPDRIDGQHVVWDEALRAGPATGLQPNVTLHLRRTGTREVEGTSRGAGIARWADRFRPQWLAMWVFPFLSVVPFALAALWARRHARSRRRRFDALLWLQVLTVGVLPLWRVLERLDGRIATWAGHWLLSHPSWRPGRRILSSVALDGLFSYPALVGVAAAAVAAGWLVTAQRLWSDPSEAVAHEDVRVRRAVAFAFAVLAVAMIAVPARDLRWVSTGGYTGALAVVVMAATTAMLWPRHHGEALVAGLGVVATVEVASFAVAFDLGREGALDTTVVVTFAVLASVAILAGFWAAVSAVLTGSSPLAWLRRRAVGVGSRVLLLVTAASLVSAALLWPTDGRQLSAFDPVSVSRVVAELFPFLLVALFLRELRAQSDQPSASGWTFEPAWHAGAIALLALVFEPTKTFWFVPVAAPIALGGLWLLFRPTAARQPSQPYPALRDRLSVLAQLIALRRLERIERKAREERLAKVAAGAMTEADSATAQAAIDRQRQELLTHVPPEAGRTVDSLDKWVSGHGPGDTAWKSGEIGAGYAAIVGLPWIIVYWRQALIEGGDLLFALETVLPMITVALTWVGYGFFFGYYYAYIPGRRAVTKSVALAAVLVAPFACYGAAVLVPRGVESWTSLSVLGAQIVGHLLVIAVLFDVHLVHRAGMPGGMVVELRDLRPLVSWAGALGVAVGGVVASVLVTSFATALSTGLGFLTSPEGPPPAPARPVVTTVSTPAP